MPHGRNLGRERSVALSQVMEFWPMNLMLPAAAAVLSLTLLTPALALPVAPGMSAETALTEIRHKPKVKKWDRGRHLGWTRGRHLGWTKGKGHWK